MAQLSSTFTEAQLGPSPYRIGLISDTHGLLRPEALEALRGSHHILHAGDIGSASILADLGALAPVTAVRGNNDHGDWARELPQAALVRFGTVLIYVLHDLAELDVDPGSAGITAVISGHSHQPRSVERDGVLFVNPGSAGPRRFKLPVTLAHLTLVGGEKPACDLKTLVP
ncbi:MAG: metallophosphoesterase family protein [Burkholderiaceae bacterium]|jgi:putative phosphoesterase